MCTAWSAPGLALRSFAMRVVGARLVAGGEDDAGALLRQADGGDFTDAGGGAGDDDGLALHMKKAPAMTGAF